MLQLPPESQFPVRLDLRSAFFALQASLRQAHGMTPKWLFELEKVKDSPHIHVTTTPQVLNFTPFRHTISHFWDIGNFSFFIAHYVEFHSFLKFKFEISKFQEETFVWIVTGNIQKKFGRKESKL